MFCAGSEKHFSKYHLLKNIIPQCFHCGIMLRLSKSLAEFAPAGANRVSIIFSGDMRVGENTARLANVRAERVRCGEPQPFQTRAQRSGSRLRACQKYFFDTLNIIPQCFHCGIMLIIGCSKSPQSLFFYSIKIFCSRLVSGCKEMMGCIVGRLQTLCEGCFF